MKTRRVLVTGASRGIGKAIAIALAKEGFEVCVNYRSNQNAAQEVCSSIEGMGGSASLLCFDIGDRKACREILEQDIADRGAFYGVVCNAGVHRDAAFPAFEDDDWDSVVHTNLDGFYNVLHPLVMPMIHLKSGGRIVTLSSVSGLMGNRGQVNYSASKAGLIGATKALSLELAKRKITVNCVAPGVIDTDMTDSLDQNMLANMIPLRRAGSADEVAALVRFLFSDSASYITRQVISVNGGLC